MRQPTDLTQDPSHNSHHRHSSALCFQGLRPRFSARHARGPTATCCKKHRFPWPPCQPFTSCWDSAFLPLPSSLLPAPPLHPLPGGPPWPRLPVLLKLRASWGPSAQCPGLIANPSLLPGLVATRSYIHSTQYLRDPWRAPLARLISRTRPGRLGSIKRLRQPTSSAPRPLRLDSPPPTFLNAGPICSIDSRLNNRVLPKSRG